MLTNRGKYGLKAMVQLASLQAGKTMQAGEIAEANAIPKKFLDAILMDLRKAGFVRAQKGPGGGYALAHAPQEIQVGAIIRALDGPLAPIACASRTAYKACEDCINPEFCSVRLIMADVRDAMAQVLDSMTLAQMAKRADTARLWSASPSNKSRK
jgi:Rrf2 family protein